MRYGTPRSTALSLLLGVALLSPGCTRRASNGTTPTDQRLRLATTTSTVGSGLLDELLPVFEKKFGVRVEVIAKGSGAAIELARKGDADVLLANAPEAEHTFVMEGFGVNRREVMYNDFVILGPPEDPISLSGELDAAFALQRIAGQQSSFLSRGDNSGTHMREEDLWTLAEVKPSGQWYRASGKGMRETLEMASASSSYVLSDRSTYLSNRERLNLVIVVEGDKRLFNPYGVIAVNPIRVPDVNFIAAMSLVDFITSPQGQQIIRDFGKDEFSRSLFTPLAIRD